MPIENPSPQPDCDAEPDCRGDRADHFSLHQPCISYCGPVSLRHWFLAVQPIFDIPAQILSGKALAAGIGFCTTMGAFFSFLAPIIRVEAESQFNSPPAGLITLALFSLLSATLIFSLKFWPSKATAEVI